MRSSLRVSVRIFTLLRLSVVLSIATITNPTIAYSQAIESNTYVAKSDEEKRALDEYDDAFQDSEFVRRAIANCHGVSDIESLTGNDRYFFEMQDEKNPAAKSLNLSGVDRSILQLDWRLRMDRWRTDKSALVLQSNSWWVQILLIIFGGLSTILIATKAMEKYKEITWISVVAIVCSSVSTGVASWNTFTAPAAAEATTRQRLATLRGIHQRLVQTVQIFYTDPLCPMPEKLALPVPLSTTATNIVVSPSLAPTPNTKKGHAAAPPTQSVQIPFQAAYARLMDETSKLKDEYLTTLGTGSTQNGDPGKQPHG